MRQEAAGQVLELQPIHGVVKDLRAGKVIPPQAFAVGIGLQKVG